MQIKSTLVKIEPNLIAACLRMNVFYGDFLPGFFKSPVLGIATPFACAAPFTITESEAPSTGEATFKLMAYSPATPLCLHRVLHPLTIFNVTYIIAIVLRRILADIHTIIAV